MTLRSFWDHMDLRGKWPLDRYPREGYSGHRNHLVATPGGAARGCMTSMLLSQAGSSLPTIDWRPMALIECCNSTIKAERFFKRHVPGGSAWRVTLYIARQNRRHFVGLLVRYGRQPTALARDFGSAANGATNDHRAAGIWILRRASGE
jgi:hypothetical protein